jgi:hypothetical protein
MKGERKKACSLKNRRDECCSDFPFVRIPHRASKTA